MPRPMKIDFVSDVACPWCAVGLNGLEQALGRTGDLIDATITFQPFELNPDMPREGEDGAEHITRKYGISADQAAANRAVIRDRAAAVGFDMGGIDMGGIDGRRVYNTFDAHRLLHWAEGTGRQAALKHALLEANFTQGLDVSDPDILVSAAERAGLDGAAAREVLSSGRYAQEVREAERLWQSRGINSVPAIVIDGRYLISGGQPPEAFERALRQIVAEAA